MKIILTILLLSQLLFLFDYFIFLEMIKFDARISYFAYPVKERDKNSDVAINANSGHCKYYF